MNSNNRNFIINSILIVIFILAFLSCSGDDPLGNDNESLQGTITVSGNSDHSGIAVEVYPLVNISQELQDAADNYGGSGPLVAQETVFNPADTLKEYSTVTGSDGSWSISGMQPGFYNIVYRGGDVGLHVETDVEVPGNPRGVTVNPKLILPSIVPDQTLLIQDQTIEVSGNITITDATSLTFSGTNYLLFTTGSSRLTVEAELNFQNNATLSSYRFAGTEIPRIVFSGQNNMGVRGLRAIDDLRVQVNSASLSFADCVFKGGTSAGLELIASTVSVSRSQIRNSIEGISLMQMSSFNCDNSIFHSNNTALLASIVGQGVIEKNTFLVQNEGVECGSSNGNTIIEIRNNLFRGGEQQILLGPNSIVQIRQNEFHDASKNIHLEPVSHPVPSIDVVINQNSFINTSTFALEVENTTALDTVNALSNFWGTTNINEINNLIFDRNDRPNETSIRFVNYTPFATEPVAGAGIGGN